jgi:hypothetical protein
VDRIRNGRVVTSNPVTPATRTMPRIGDVVRIEWGKHLGTVGRVTGRLDMPTGTTWKVCDVGGTVLGDYAAGDLTIVGRV